MDVCIPDSISAGQGNELLAPALYKGLELQKYRRPLLVLDPDCVRIDRISKTKKGKKKRKAVRGKICTIQVLPKIDLSERQ